jgi:hypothetical protein
MMPFDQVMHKFKHGELKSGSGGKVKNRKQAIAIMLSEKRESKTKPEYRSKSIGPSKNFKGFK